MKKLLFCLFTISLCLGMVSCGEQDKKEKEIEDKQKIEKATSLQELYKKYDGVKFKDCDEMIQFGYEYIDVLVDVIDRAAEGDEEALEELDQLDEFFSQFEEQEDLFEKECPEKFEEYLANIEEKMEKYLDKLIGILLGSMDYWEDYLDSEDYENFIEDNDWFNYEEVVEEL